MDEIISNPKQVLQDVWPLAVLAYAVSITLTPVARWTAYRKGIVDRPDDLLKPHGRPVAYLGGLAVCAGFLTALAVRYADKPDRWSLAMPIALGALVITLVGLLDDLKNLRPRYKVLGQVLAAEILYAGLITHGIHKSAAGMLFWPLGLYPPEWATLVFSGVLTAVIVIAACNATNLLDGLDGLCGGVTGVIALGFVALTVYLACFGHWEAEGTDEMRVVVCLSMAGAVLGFLPYNVPPASIFLGDAGSMLLGFLVATMMLLFAREGTPRWLLAACVIFALPILDTGLAVVRRALSGKNIFTGDRSHLYDQLVDRGMSVKRVVALFYILAVLAAVLGVCQGIFLHTWQAVILDLVLAGVVVTIFIWKGMILPPPRMPQEEVGSR